MGGYEKAGYPLVVLKRLAYCGPQGRGMTEYIAMIWSGNVQEQ
jgi:hypothetical protein